MDLRQQDLLDRLTNVLDFISGSPKTASEVNLIFEDLVTSFEEIAGDLRATPDEQEAITLQNLVHVAELY